MIKVIAAHVTATHGDGVTPKNATISRPEAKPAPITVPITSIDIEKIFHILYLYERSFSIITASLTEKDLTYYFYNGVSSFDGGDSAIKGNYHTVRGNCLLSLNDVVAVVLRVIIKNKNFFRELLSVSSRPR